MPIHESPTLNRSKLLNFSVAASSPKTGSRPPLANLEHIGVDELSYRKQHHYVTLVTDHKERRIVWGKEGKSAETLLSFFKELGPEGCERIKAVTIDMSQAYINAVK